MLKETVWNKIFNLIIKKIFYCTWNSRWGFDLLKVQCKVRDVRIFYLQCMLVLCLYIAPFLQSSDIIVHRHNVHCTPAQCTLSIVIFSSVQKTNLCTKKSILEIPVCSLRYFCILSSHSQNKLKENFTKWKKTENVRKGKGWDRLLQTMTVFSLRGAGGERHPLQR